MRTALTEAGGLVGNLKEADEKGQVDQGGDILVIDENDRDDQELDSDEEEEREKRERKRRGSVARRSSVNREVKEATFNPTSRCLGNSEALCLDPLLIWAKLAHGLELEVASLCIASDPTPPVF